MQAMGVPPTGQVAIAVAQRGVLQNPGGATGNLGGAAAGGAPASNGRRWLGRVAFRKNVVRQVQGGTPTTNNNNPVAAQLLLAPTFTPIQANAILDQTNMRIAIPVRQVDGEYILTMQKMQGAPAAQPAEGQRGQQPTPAEGQRPAQSSAGTAEGKQPSAAQGESPSRESSAPATESQAPKAREGSNSTSPAGGSAKPTEGQKKNPEARQEKKAETDKYGQAKAPQGAIIMTMKMVDDMAASVQWGGQAPITQMMQEYVKAQTGQDLFKPNNATEGTTKLVV